VTERAQVIKAVGAEGSAPAPKKRAAKKPAEAKE
jgi:hypothetical protein